jgi:hypothetical protein
MPDNHADDSSDTIVERGAPIVADENADYAWDEFDSIAYWAHNYGTLREDDRKIVELVRDFFSGMRDVYEAEGLDVGTGPNLYPAMAMLPLCRNITLWEHSQANVNWLQGEVARHSPQWYPFWDVLKQKARYKRLGDSRTAIAARAKVTKGSIFDLPQDTWDIGTMFFVAESITRSRHEFNRALKKFFSALKPKAPFAVALMENSRGYKAGSNWYPAIKVDRDTVLDKLLPYADNPTVMHIASDGSLREGYSGMILALGRLAK